MPLKKDERKQLVDRVAKKKGLKITNPKPKWSFKSGEKKSVAPKLNVQILSENPLIVKATEDTLVDLTSPGKQTLAERPFESHPPAEETLAVRGQELQPFATGTLVTQLVGSMSGLTTKQKEAILVDILDVPETQVELEGIDQVELAQQENVHVKPNSSNRFAALQDIKG
ncbi:OLC1v1008632C1 [Oldenlandia corymbosa var. corymbosa]|uniref:OLC1v1008632C1 n=1 Tax=Oldenlandia corymbosa var. corymbosa TaxID=529605 RepID=A0AAV1DMF8_OLDCO|nr:OLC1v1008632C1 [Oldenlandia corymbosa var. corymbosa]